MDALRPGLKHIVTALADMSSSVRMLWCAARFDTGYNLFLFLLEWWHLRVHSASFAEHFFGLRRQEIAPSQKLTPLEKVELARRRKQAPNLTGRQCLASLLVLVVIPCVRRHLETRFRQAESVPSNRRSRLQSLFVAVYPWIHATSSVVGLSYRVAYLLEQTHIWSPSLHGLRLCVVRHFPEPPAAEDEDKTRLQKLWDMASMLGSGSLWGALYLMQFGQWWYQRESLLQPFQPRKVPPPPPQCSPYGSKNLSPNAALELVLLPQDRRICPLCHRIRRNPALSSSGYAFCFTCLVPHVERCGYCPVTGQATSAQQIRRVRDD